MSSQINYSISRYREANDGTVEEEADYDLVVEYRMTAKGSPPQLYGPPENCDPGWDAEFEIDRVTWNGEPFELRASEEEALYTHIVETHEEPEREDD